MTICSECRHMVKNKNLPDLPLCRATRAKFVNHDTEMFMQFISCETVNAQGNCPKFEEKPVKATPSSLWKLWQGRFA